VSNGLHAVRQEEDGRVMQIFIARCRDAMLARYVVCVCLSVYLTAIHGVAALTGARVSLLRPREGCEVLW